MSCKILPPEKSNRVIRVSWPEVGPNGRVKPGQAGLQPAKPGSVLRAGQLPAVSGGAWAASNSGNADVAAGFSHSATGPTGPPPADFPDVEAIRKEAYEKGLREGRAVSQEEAAAQLQPILDRLSGMLASLAEQRVRLRQEAESDLVRLSLAIAKRILNREITVDPLSLQGLIRAALSKLERGESAQVRVSPSEFETVQLCVQRLNLSSPLEVVSDQSLGTGVILFKTSKGVVDASVETQLQEIERGFADRLRA